MALQVSLNQRKRSPFEAEKEIFEKHQNIHVHKAINNIECAPKEKHVRAVILGTFQTQGAHLFWNLSTKLQIQGHPIVCWKFCHVVHKILREGHPNCIKQSQSQAKQFTNLGKLWGLLKNGYGRSIAAFTNLILQKLRFHGKNHLVPGNLQISSEVMSQTTHNDINSFFELSVDMLDYMDEILHFQDAVFSSLDRSRSNSMTAHGQCKLTPIVLCIQDSSSLYDNLVKLLFKLHSSLSPETLSGHRERFVKQYRVLQTFYRNSQNLQYFKNWISVPTLPDNPPNFLIESELHAHRAPVVTVAEQEDDTPESELDSSSILADFGESEVSSQVSDSRFDSIFADFSFNGNMGNTNNNNSENSARIEELLAEIERLKREMEQMRIEHKDRVNALLGRIKTLEEEVKKLVQLKSQLEEERELDAGNKSQYTDRMAAMEEKFNKMKDMYTKIREEHVALLRTNSKATKELMMTKQALDAKEAEYRAKMDEFAHLEHQRLVFNEVQKSADGMTQQLTDAKTRLLDLERTNAALQEQVKVLNTSNDKLQGEMNIWEQNKDQLERERMDAKERVNQLESQLRSAELSRDALQAQLSRIEAKLRDMSKVKEDLDELRRQLLFTTCQRAMEAVRETLDYFDAPELASCRGSAEFLLSRVDKVMTEVTAIEDICGKYLQDPSGLDFLLGSIASFSSRMCECMLQGKATSHSVPNADQSEALVTSCKLTAEESITFLSHLSSGHWQGDQVKGLIASLLSHLRHIQSQADMLKPKVRDVRQEEIGDMIEAELQSTFEAIQSAEQKFKELLAKSRQGQSGIELEVNESILDSCTDLMNCIRILIEKSKVLQKEIVAEGRGTSSVLEFYKKHHRWTEGLISGAKSVGFAATTLVDAADKLVSDPAGDKGSGRFDELCVCSQEIANSTAQLVVASRVKANPQSYSLVQLENASKSVSQATGRVNAAARAGSERHDEAVLLGEIKADANSNLTQRRKVRMNCQVRVLELERELELERRKLDKLREADYKAGAEELVDEMSTQVIHDLDITV